jgi:sodium pump decarboxylase gamma subunit
MSELLVQGLLISVIGMGLVFGALILLWLMMAVLSRLTLTRRPASSNATKPQAPALAEVDAGPTGAELAAIAAALALLHDEQEAESALGWRLPPVLTRWVAVGYSRHLRSWQPRRTQRDA